MSLFVGNLAPGVRQDELERMFRKFGSCTVLKKGNYGFVWYESPHHAERALRALQDTYIRGENLTLAWSKQQRGRLPDSRRNRDRERVAGRDREGRRKETEFVREEYSSRKKEKSSASSRSDSVSNTSRSNSKSGSSNHKRGCYSRSVSSRAHSPSSYSRSRLLRRNETGREEIERSRSKPRKRLRYSRDSGPASRELSRTSRSVGRSPARNGDDNSQRNSYEGKMRRRKEPGFVKEYSRRKEKRLVLYSSDSDSNTPRSNLKSCSSNHRRGYHSRSSSRSVSSRAHSASSSRSGSRMVEVDVLSEDAKPENRQQATNDKLPTSPSLLAQFGLADKESSESSGSEDDTSYISPRTSISS